MKSKQKFTFWRATLLCVLICLGPETLQLANAQVGPQSAEKMMGVPEGYTIIEGDIQMPISVVNAMRSRTKSKTAAPQDAFNRSLWPNGAIPYEFDANVTAANQALMSNAMVLVQTGANIHFQQCSNNACRGDFVHIQDNPQSNNSAVGRQGGRQVINIVSWSEPFIIGHELMHCLGIFHEQSRPDRNSFVTININNVQPKLGDNFELRGDALTFGEYDFDSLMHYAKCDFSLGCGKDANGNAIQSCSSCNGQETITVNEPYRAQWQNAIGQRTHLSDLNRLTLKLLYSYPNWRFVDGRYTGQRGASNGTLVQPYQSLSTGINATPVGGVLWILPGTYFVNSLTKAITLGAPFGNVELRALQGAAGDTLATVSAASYNGEVASESIAAAFGENLASGTAAAAALPLPTTLGGVTVKIKDSAEVERDAPLFFVSPGQINYLVPAGASVGPAGVAVYKNGALVASSEIPVTATAPGLFTANSSGQGAPAALVLRIRGEEQFIESLMQYDETQKKFVPIPIDLGPEGDQIFLILFGTGFRSASSPSSITAIIGDEQADVVFAGGLGGFAGLDQANVRLPRSLAGKGEVSVLLIADNRSANAVTINVR